MTLSFHDFIIGTEQGRILLELDSARSSIQFSAGLHLLTAPNGYGKSTLLQTLAGIRRPIKGHCRWQGKPIASTYYFSEYLRIPQYIYPLEWIDYLSGGQLKEIPEEWFDRLSLRPLLGRTLGRLSQGERRKLEWLAATWHPSELLLLDEPLDGLDLLALHEIQELLKIMKAKGKLILLIAHQAAEVFAVLDKVWLFQGKSLRDYDVLFQDNYLKNKDFLKFQDQVIQSYMT